ncbi:MAG TPA: hypothetical protein VGR36_08275 [Candidatus Acidoferrales bacterium]|nr:hypothetical protein [Candidatus Acidoferrales bacterium]
MRKRLIVTAVILFGAAGIAAAQAPSQNESQEPAKQAKPKPAKVWTDDNIGSVRSASDDYIIEQQKEKQAEQQTAAKQAADQKAAAADASAPPTWPKPKSIQEADQMISQKQQFLSSEQNTLKELQNQVNDPTVTGFERTRVEWRLKSHTVTAQQARDAVKQLEDDKKELEKKEAADKNSGSGDNSGSNQN